MRGPKAPKLVVSDRQRAILERFTRATTAAVSLVERSRIVLLSASGMATLHVAAALDVDRQRVRRWRHRWAKELSAKLTAVEAKADDKVLAAAIEEALADRRSSPKSRSPGFGPLRAKSPPSTGSHTPDGRGPSSPKLPPRRALSSQSRSLRWADG